MTHLLEVKDLVTKFYTEQGVVNAVNGISYTLDEGESIAIVGESGSGKSVSVLSIMGLIPSPPGRVDSGQALFNGRDMLHMKSEELRHIRGREMAMVFQDPMTSLNPVFTIGDQIGEAVLAHEPASEATVRQRTIELLDDVGIVDAGRRPRRGRGHRRIPRPR